MAMLDRDGVRIYYEDHDPDQGSGQGPVVLLTHGYSATSQMWRGQVDALAGARVITWDLRGHGQSDSPEDERLYSEAVAVDDMVGILDACGVETAVIGGLSLGGYLALAFHVRQPERVRALGLFDTGPGYRNDAARAEWNEMAETRATHFAERGLEALGRGAEVRVSSHRSAEGLARAARGTLRQFDSRVIDSLPTIAVPTLVLVGEKDRRFHAATDYMAAKIPGATKVVVPDAGHAANIDQPAAFNEALQQFLAGVSR